MSVIIPSKVVEIALKAPIGGFALSGLLLTGSFARGEATEHSDIDLLGITADAVRWRKFYREGSHDVDLFVVSNAIVDGVLKNREQPMLQMIATAGHCQ